MGKCDSTDKLEPKLPNFRAGIVHKELTGLGLPTILAVHSMVTDDFFKNPRGKGSAIIRD